MTPRAWAAGLLVMSLGEAVRLSGVAVAGPETRRRSRGVAHLVTNGPFAWVRNPLYVGNGLAWLGIAIASGVPWLIPLGIIIFSVEYGLIVRYEEGVLESLFGAAYLAYKGRTPRWLPRPPAARPRPVGRHFDWRGAWRSESSTFLNLALAVAALLMKALIVAARP
jgi:protein-S-isoprenylcysteine O-methyltransferase Ste14